MMRNREDGRSPKAVQGAAQPAEQAPLTEAQRDFAVVLGRLLAERWRQGPRDGVEVATPDV